MAASIDERVVSVAFENSQFEKNVAVTMATITKLNASLKSISSEADLGKLEKESQKVTLSGPMAALEKLKSKLHFGEAPKAFGDLEGASHKVQFAGIHAAVDKAQAKLTFPQAPAAFAELEHASEKVHFGGVTKAVDSIQARLGALQIAGIAVFTAIANSAITQFAAVGQQVTGLGAVLDGFKDYELKIGSTQTIMSGTGEGIETVSKYLKELDEYADRTIYSLRDMTGNIGKFTNAGVKLPIAVNAMKGIANLAALSGANAEEAARAMYNLGQAIGQGTVRMADWRSIELANMGTKEFKEQLIEAALAEGTLRKEADGTLKSLKGNEVNFKTFGSTLQDQWLTAEALTKTLNKYSDETTDLGKRAYAAATNVKTASMMLETLAAAAGTGWTDTFEIMLGNLPEATKLWTGMTNVIGGFLGKSADMRNEALKDWKELGGREDVIKGISAAFEALIAILKPVGQAFRDIFPRKTGEELAELSENFREFMEGLKIAPETADGLRRTFAGLFAILSIVKTVVGEVIGVIFDLLGVVGKGSGGFLAFTGGIGDFLVALEHAIDEGEALAGFFDGLSAILAVPVELIKALAGGIATIFSGQDSGAAASFADSMEDLDDRLAPLKATIDIIVGAWEKLIDVLDRVKTEVTPWVQEIGNALAEFGDVVLKVFEDVDYDEIFALIQTTLIGGIFLTIKKALGGGISELGGGFLGNLNQLFEGLTGNLQAMQKNIQADTLMKIAASIGLLAASVFIFSQIDAGKTTQAMTAIAVGLAQLVGAMALMTKIGGKTGFLMVPFIASAMVLLAGALVILAGAVKLFSTMEWEEIAKGLAGVGGSLAAIGLGMKAIGGVKIMPVALALIPLAVGMVVLASALKQFGSLDWVEIGKGLVGMGLALVVIGDALILMPPTMPLTAAGLILMGIALGIIAGAIKGMGNMDVATLAKGIVAMGLAIAAIGLALNLIPPHVALLALGLVVLGGALMTMAAAIGILGSMSIGKLAKGLVSMGLALVTLALGLTLMIAAAPGALALLAASAALAVLAPTLAFLGKLNWGTIFKGLTAVALTLGVIAVAGLAAAPALTALGFALLPLGLAMLVIAKSLQMVAEGLALMGDKGQAGVAAMIAALTGFVALLPTILINFIQGLVKTIGMIAEIAPKVVIALGIVINSILAAVIEAVPKIAEAAIAIVNAFLDSVNANLPRFLDTGWAMLKKLLEGVDQNIEEVTEKVISIVAKFLDAAEANMPRLTTAGADMMLAFVSGVTDEIPGLTDAVTGMVTTFMYELKEQIPEIVAAAAELMGGLIAGILSFGPQLTEAGVKTAIEFVAGFGKSGPELLRRGAETAAKFLKGLSKELVGLVDIGFQATIDFINGLADAIRTRGPELRQAGYNLASALLEGLEDGILELGGRVVDKLGDLVRLLPNKVQKILGIKSPSTVFIKIGGYIMEGLAQGMEDESGTTTKAAESAGKDVIFAFQDVFGIASPSKVMKEIGKQVGEGFAQGLKGSRDDIQNAFRGLADRLRQEIHRTKDIVAQEQLKLDELLASKKPDYEAIAESRKVIAENEEILRRSRAAHKELTVYLKDEKRELIGLTKEYETLGVELEKRMQELDAIVREREGFQKSITDQLSKPTDFELKDDSNIFDYQQHLKDRIAAVKKFAETMAKLRAAGLDDAAYRRLIEAGPEQQEFADLLLSTGERGVQDIAKLNAELAAEAAKLGETAATELYKTGQDLAQGLVDGLKSRQGELEAQMKALAKSMVAAIKKELKIKSPSEVFIEIGELSMVGMAKGVEAGTKGVEDSMTSAAKGAVDAAHQAMLNMPSLGDLAEVDPVIRPVLDLSLVEREAKRLGDMTNVTPITAAPSYQQAVAISAEQQAASAAQDEQLPKGDTFNFEQNNYSPESLSDAEIYRRTNNQLSQLRNVLGLSS